MRKPPVLVFWRAKDLRDPAVCPGPLWEVVVYPLHHMANSLFLWLQWVASEGFGQPYLLSTALVGRRGSQKPAFVQVGTFPPLFWNTYDLQYEPIGAHTFQPGIKFQPSLFWASWIQRKYFILLYLDERESFIALLVWGYRSRHIYTKMKFES